MDTQVLASLIVIGLVASIIGAGTYAYFSDTETSSANTLAAGTLNLKVNNGPDPYVGSLVQILNLKPSAARYSSAINITIENNSGKVFKRISHVVCTHQPNPGLDTNTWFDLNVNGVQLIPDNAKTVKDLEDKWIYMGVFSPRVKIPVIQSFHLQACLPSWVDGETCTFDEEFMVMQINDPTIPSNCYNPYGGDCPSAVEIK
jgi:predicted ribosomally synthesized peptide with SipW-like signal peptide